MSSQNTAEVLLRWRRRLRVSPKVRFVYSLLVWSLLLLCYLAIVSCPVFSEHGGDERKDVSQQPLARSGSGDLVPLTDGLEAVACFGLVLALLCVYAVVRCGRRVCWFV